MKVEIELEEYQVQDINEYVERMQKMGYDCSFKTAIDTLFEIGYTEIIR